MTDKKQKRKPRSYTNEFKQQLVLLYQNGKRKCDKSKRLQIPGSTYYYESKQSNTADT